MPTTSTLSVSRAAERYLEAIDDHHRVPDTSVFSRIAPVMVSMRRHDVLKARRTKENRDDEDNDISAQFISKSNAEPRAACRRAKLDRADTPVLERIENGSEKGLSDPPRLPALSNASVSSSTSNDDDDDDDENSNGQETEDSQPLIGKTSEESVVSKHKRRLLNEVDVDKYMSLREMTPLQERVNAITVIPGAFYCLLFLLSGAWLDQSLKDEIRDVLVSSNVQYSGETGCIASSWFPHLHSLPPLPVVSAAVGVILHFPFSFLYHWHYAHRLPAGLARTTHWSRRMDQAMIHMCSAFMAYATSGRLDFFLVNLLFNIVCAVRQFQPRVYPRLNQLGIFVSVVAYTIPVLRRDLRLFGELWLIFGSSAWLFAAYPVGGWSHSLFHIILAFAPALLMNAAIDLPASQEQLKVAARCAFIGQELLES